MGSTTVSIQRELVMNKMIGIVTAVLLAAAGPENQQAEFKPMFNGKDLSGWQTAGRGARTLL